MRYIKVTEARRKEAIKDFIEFLTKERTLTNEIKYTCKLTDVDETKVIKPKLFFTAKAWIKMNMLVNAYTSEVAWHGTVSKLDNEKYLIDDILVYPQEVTGTTATADDQEYPRWLIDLDDDTANRLRFQGHSHVNFGATPSNVDTNYYENILNSVKEDSWYFFMIMNKKGEFWLQCHDFSQNIVFDTDDIELAVLLDDNTSHTVWLNDVDELVKTRTFVSHTPTTPKSGAIEHDWYGNYHYGSYYGGERCVTDDETYDDTRFSVNTQAATKKNDKPKKSTKKTTKHNIYRR